MARIIKLPRGCNMLDSCASVRYFIGVITWRVSYDKVGRVTCERHIDMSNSNEIDSLLSPDELRALALWRKGETMTNAYKRVMLSPQESKIISKSALQKRVVRFFGTDRMRAAMAATEGDRGDRAKADYEKWKCSQKLDAIKKFADIPSKKAESRPAQQEEPPAQAPSVKTDNTALDTPQSHANAKKAWIESLQVSESPTAMSIYGTGLFLAQTAIQQIMKRKKEIEVNGVSCFEKNGTPYTALDLNALRTAASMILPFAPPPTTAERRAMSLAGVMIGLAQDAIEESPDDYTAPPPCTIEAKVDKK